MYHKCLWLWCTWQRLIQRIPKRGHLNVYCTAVINKIQCSSWQCANTTIFTVYECLWEWQLVFFPSCHLAGWKNKNAINKIQNLSNIWLINQTKYYFHNLWICRIIYTVWFLDGKWLVNMERFLPLALLAVQIKTVLWWLLSSLLV